MSMRKPIFLLVGLLAWPATAAERSNVAANSINALGIDLLTKVTKPNQNALLSPYSIQTALAMTYAGADGVTRSEMAQALHFPKDDVQIHDSFFALNGQLNEITDQSAKYVAQIKKDGGLSTPITINVANRLFGQTGYEFQPAFASVLKSKYAALLESVNFTKNPVTATERINQWVTKQTQKRIRDVVPSGALSTLTRLVLVNAIHFRAPWSSEFEESATKPLDFHLGDGTKVKVPTMYQMHSFGYAKRSGYTVVSLAYRDPRLQLIILFPDTTNNLAALEKKLTAQILTECARVNASEINLYLPRFKFEPPSIALGQSLRSLGMKSAFNDNANFSRMAAPSKQGSLCLSEVFHKTFFSLNEHETEAAAATAVSLIPLGMHPLPEKPIEVKIDRPFLFAVQHRDSGACLFLGRMVDPR